MTDVDAKTAEPKSKKLKRASVVGVREINLRIAKALPGLVNGAIQNAVACNSREVVIGFQRASDAEEVKVYINNNTKFQAIVKENKFEEPAATRSDDCIIFAPRDGQQQDKKSPFVVVFEIPVVSDDDLAVYQEEVAVYEKEKKKKLKELQHAMFNSSSNPRSYGMIQEMAMVGHEDNEDDDEDDPTKL